MQKLTLNAGVNPTLPDVALVIGGKERQLVFDMEAICRVEKLTGVNLWTSAVYIERVGFDELGAMLYAALVPAAPDLELAVVRKWVNYHNASVIFQAIQAAWFGSIPEPKKDGDESGEAEAQADPEA